MGVKKYKKYLFQPNLEISQCSSGILACQILGSKISVFERSLDSDFATFILKYLDKPFSVKDMDAFFSKKKYNYGNIILEMEKVGLIRAADKKKPAVLVLVNFTDIADNRLSNILKEFDIDCDLNLINSAKAEDNYKELDGIRDEQVIFVLSDFKNKYKVSELNLYFFKKGIYWCPIIMDRFGGYIGPLIHSVPSGPCFNCYEEKMYHSPESADKTEDIPSLSDIFLRIALLEALKVSANIFPSQIIYSNLLELDCFNHRYQKHYIYTNSSCDLCGL